MIVAIVLAGVAVLVAVVYLALGKGGELAEVHPDHPPLDLSTDRPFTGVSAASLRLPKGVWGYHVDITDQTVDRLIAELNDRDARIAWLERQLADRSGLAGRAPMQGPTTAPGPMTAPGPVTVPPAFGAAAHDEPSHREEPPWLSAPPSDAPVPPVPSAPTPPSAPSTPTAAPVPSVPAGPSGPMAGPAEPVPGPPAVAHPAEPVTPSPQAGDQDTAEDQGEEGWTPVGGGPAAPRSRWGDERYDSAPPSRQPYGGWADEPMASTTSKSSEEPAIGTAAEQGPGFEQGPGIDIRLEAQSQAGSPADETERAHPAEAPPTHQDHAG